MKAGLAIVGGGPAGLATAIHAARRGFDALVIERAPWPVDKACGEGLMPPGLRELNALGAHLDPLHCAPFHGIRYVQEDGGSVTGRFSGGDGLGVRRVELSRALGVLADAAGVRRLHASARGLALEADRAVLDTDAGPVEAGLIVGADGLASRIRSAAGLEGAPVNCRRFGLRVHLPVAARDPFVEVHWSAGAEAYLTPVGPSELNVAFLWEPDRVPAASAQELLTRFPALLARFGTLPKGRGAGPLAHRVRAVANRRVALVGDAAGYVDAITGQGLSLALVGARMLVDALPLNLSDTAAVTAGLARYAAELRRRYRAYALPASALLGLARRPALRRAALRLLTPGAFEQLLRVVD